jgi:hypothetical protein
MKSDERHKLQRNTLADWLGHAIEASKPYLNQILLGVLIVLLLGVGYFSWNKMTTASTYQSWDEFNAALGTSDVSKMIDVTTGFPKTPAAFAAATLAGDMYLAQGCDELFTDKAAGNSDLTKAVNNYDSVLANCKIDVLRERATFGLARAHEAKGELDQANESYQTVTAKWPNGAFASAASQRLVALKQPASKEFYDRFAKFNPKPAVSKDSGDKPAFDMNSLPAETPPATSGDIQFDGGKSIPAPSTSQPAAADKPAAADAPAKEPAPAENK